MKQKWNLYQTAEQITVCNIIGPQKRFRFTLIIQFFYRNMSILLFLNLSSSLLNCILEPVFEKVFFLAVDVVVLLLLNLVCFVHFYVPNRKKLCSKISSNWNHIPLVQYATFLATKLLFRWQVTYGKSGDI